MNLDYFGYDTGWTVWAPKKMSPKTEVANFSTTSIIILDKNPPGLTISQFTKISIAAIVRRLAKIGALFFSNKSREFN